MDDVLKQAGFTALLMGLLPELKRRSVASALRRLKACGFRCGAQKLLKNSMIVCPVPDGQLCGS